MIYIRCLIDICVRMNKWKNEWVNEEDRNDDREGLVEIDVIDVVRYFLGEKSRFCYWKFDGLSYYYLEGLSVNSG